MMQRFEELERRQSEFAQLLERQREWSLQTFGPFNPDRVSGLLAHIRKELDEVAADVDANRPSDALTEAVDIAVLAVDVAFQLGFGGLDFTWAYERKIEKNMARQWPDWRTVPAGQPIEHVREFDGRDVDFAGMTPARRE
jgi:hypothetical protein